ncbi:RNA polymerase sigma factor [Aliarcobacter butzleri]|uniref:RNA polymerase sigma factor n=1 Tax=Aliarcobacter butzleri TaxID=28197 RepID=UPI001EDAFFBE|nr:RNA polymerase sigma factor [Aliarcobacter butzleri]MCG3676462.1 RNA polymerase sigma factor [Aliarcobacter butzleri]
MLLEYYKEISHYIFKLTGDKALAKDLTQETYIKVLEITKTNSDIEIQKAYLYKIAQNLVIDKIRKDKLLLQTPFEENEHFFETNDYAEDLILDKIRKKKLRESIKSLPPQQKKAFVFYYYKGYTRKEIAQILDISTNAVEKNISRAILKIKVQKTGTFEHSFRKHLNSVYTFI